MKNIIDRTLFWFQDGADNIVALCNKFFALGNLLNRLLSEKYDGKKIKFINISFLTEKTFELFPNVPKRVAYFYGGHLSYKDIFDLNDFEKMSDEEQKLFLWKRVYEIFQVSAKELKNNSLLEASEYAYKKGLELELNPDYRMIEADVKIHEQLFLASIWVNFNKNSMNSKFTLEKNSKIVFEKDIDSTKLGVEFFLEIYKKIIVDGNSIIIKGHNSIDYLPLKIPIELKDIKQ